MMRNQEYCDRTFRPLNRSDHSCRKMIERSGLKKEPGSARLLSC
ncbi:MAG: hypothetical protein ABIK15_20250 [Pseudomonadota bacterium]